MGELAQTVTPQGLLAVCDFIDVPLAQVTAARPALVALLANVRDPGNAGTVLRAADAAGADAVIFADASVDVYNGKCVRASAGSLFHLPVVAGVGLPAAVAALREAGLRVLAADGRGIEHARRPAHPGRAAQPDRVAVRQRGMGASRRPAGARRRVGRGTDLRPRRVAQPRRRGGGMPVRLRAAPAGRAPAAEPALLAAC